MHIFVNASPLRHLRKWLAHRDHLNITYLAVWLSVCLSVTHFWCRPASALELSCMRYFDFRRCDVRYAHVGLCRPTRWRLGARLSCIIDIPVIYMSKTVQLYISVFRFQNPCKSARQDYFLWTECQRYCGHCSPM